MGLHERLAARGNQLGRTQQQLQPTGRRSEPAGNGDGVPRQRSISSKAAGPSPCTAPRFGKGGLSYDGDGEDDDGRGNGVSTDDARANRAGDIGHSPAQLQDILQLLVASSGEDRERVSGKSAHARDIADIGRHRPPAHVVPVHVPEVKWIPSTIASVVAMVKVEPDALQTAASSPMVTSSWESPGRLRPSTALAEQRCHLLDKFELADVSQLHCGIIA